MCLGIPYSVHTPYNVRSRQRSDSHFASESQEIGLRHPLNIDVYIVWSRTEYVGMGTEE